MGNFQSAKYNNSTIFYRISGTGKPVVLLHGFGEDGNIWNDLAAKLAENFKVIIPDIPGSGKSEILNDDEKQISTDDYAKVIMHILNKENVTTCTIIGHSMGGYITLAIAEKYPGILNGFGLFHSSAFADNGEKKQARLKSIEFLKTNDSAAFLKTSIPGLFANKFKQEHPDVIENLVESGNLFSSKALIQYYQAMIDRPERIEVLKQTTLPVLFIIGEKDQAIPLQQSLTQCHLPSTSYVHILPNAGHMGMLEEKELCNNIVISFLNNLN
jgi:pimeloyl-ACP methyl ester carboxylesterase